MMRLLVKPFLILAACIGMASAHAASFAGVSFCGGTVTPGDPTDMENQVGDMTLQAAVEQPASITTCSKGYLLAKCGDHESANKIFDKCIAAGYVGAMIWKALQFENGNGVPLDLKAAADLLRRAAMSNDAAYGPIGRMHYATVLQEGRGVDRNPEEAMALFRRAAAEGSAEAAEFLRSGYHTGARDGHGMGAGTPTAAALAPLEGAVVEGVAGSPAGIAAAASSVTVAKAIALTQKTADAAVISPPSAAVAAETDVSGQRLNLEAPAEVKIAPAYAGIAWLLLIAFIAGAMLRRAPTGLSVRLPMPNLAT